MMSQVFLQPRSLITKSKPGSAHAGTGQNLHFSPFYQKICHRYHCHQYRWCNQYIFEGESSKASRHPLWEYSDQKTTAKRHEQGAFNDCDDDDVMVAKYDGVGDESADDDDDDDDDLNIDRWILGTAWPTAQRQMLLISKLLQVRLIYM